MQIVYQEKCPWYSTVMKLFLYGGGGGRADSIELDKKFVAHLDLLKPLLYIPIAIEIEKHPYSACHAWIRNLLTPLGVSDIVMWTEQDLTHKKPDDFTQFCGIYIGGGNTFKLLNDLRRFEVVDILKDLAHKDIPIAGGSAGAIILGRTIMPALCGDENLIGLTDLTGLNLISGVDIWCHYDPAQDAVIARFTQEHNLKKLICIPENAGLYVTDASMQPVGTSPVYVFENSTKVQLT